MKVMINNLIEELENLNKKNNIENKEQILEKAFIEIQFFQHERLIHLMVTFFVGIAAIIILGFSIVTEILGRYLLFLVLFISINFYLYL